MSRFARERRVFYWEEPVFEPEDVRTSAEVVMRACPETGVIVATPHLVNSQQHEALFVLEDLLLGFTRRYGIEQPITWFYTPMALGHFPLEIKPSVVIYDCMDELSMFRGAPAELRLLERELLRMADLVFTGGVSLFEAKRHLHPHVHAFASGVDAAHFRQARNYSGEMPEHANLSRPRLGYAGVIDERIDMELVEDLARQRPTWEIIMIGPTAKIDPAGLPVLPNLHWLGMRSYAELPKYFAGWDAALMPFALNDATRFISPTKTPEYLCAGLPVISTAIRDVVRPYGELGLVHIAENAQQFIAVYEQFAQRGEDSHWLERADAFLQKVSWDSVWEGMNGLIEDRLHTPARALPAPSQEASIHV